MSSAVTLKAQPVYVEDMLWRIAEMMVSLHLPRVSTRLALVGPNDQAIANSKGKSPSCLEFLGVALFGCGGMIGGTTLSLFRSVVSRPVLTVAFSNFWPCRVCTHIGVDSLAVRLTVFGGTGPHAGFTPRMVAVLLARIAIKFTFGLAFTATSAFKFLFGGHYHPQITESIY